MAHDSEWTDWIEHRAGDPCPIPDAKAGEFEVRNANGVERRSFPVIATFTSTWNEWTGKWMQPDYCITHYRLRKPSPDWKGIADELATALEDVARYSGHAPAAEFNAVCSALTRYREANRP